MTHSNHTWLPVLAQLTESHTPCVLITVTSAKGSTPREAGTKMVVTETEQFGTIGGGNLEFEAIAEARELLQNLVSAPQHKDYALGPTLAQCCGGAVSVMLEPFIPNPTRVLLFGAGHVGKEVVQVLAGLPIRVLWVDERAQEFPATLPANTEKLVTSTPVSAAKKLGNHDFMVVMTHSHDLDYDLVKVALSENEAAYIGLIGSDTKRTKFLKRLRADGLNEAQLERLTCPIGIAGISGKHPREIAIALVAELLTLGLTHPMTEGVHP